MNGLTVAAWVGFALFTALTIAAARNEQTTVPPESRMLVLVFSLLMAVGCLIVLVVRWR